MRFFSILFIAALLLIPACAVTVRDGGHGGGHRSSHNRHHSGRHHRHRSHHHWNAAGPAYAEAKNISTIVILAATLPTKIDGEFTAAEETEWRRDWPMLAAQLMADGLTARTESAVTGTVSQEKPVSGYYMTLAITYIDIGDRAPGPDGKPLQRGSSLAAHCTIFNGATSVMVADVKFTESTGWTGSVPFEGFMAAAGNSLGDWFIAKRK
jgi:hypothetical protein